MNYRKTLLLCGPYMYMYFGIVVRLPLLNKELLTYLLMLHARGGRQES